MYLNDSDDEQGSTHPPAAAACKHVLPRLSGVSIWKPADRTESLHIMLNLRPDEGSTARRREARQHTAAAAAAGAPTERQREEKQVGVERKTGVSATGGENENQVIIRVQEQHRDRGQP